MNKDFSKHHKIINNFRGEVSSNNFETNFSAVTKHLTKTEKFLLKMELKRLAGLCTRAIDLRGLVDGECQLFDFQGQSHFLDNIAIATFNENVAIYGGYTFGVYEVVKDAKNSFRNLYKNEQVTPNSIENNKKSSIDKLQYPAKLQLFANYPDRVEERMNFAISITLTLSNKQQLITTSIDLSVTGIKFKLINEVTLFKGDQLTIAFTGLEQEFQFNKDSLFSFDVKNVLRDSGTQLIGCQRIAIPDNDSFERFLAGYIQGNKRRYKINLDNSLVALQARSLEQYTLVKLNELVVFMHGTGADSVANTSPRYALTTRNNQKLYQYWLDDKKHSTLHYLINAERLQRLVTLPAGKSLLVFSFTHQHKGRKYFYTVDEEQLKDDDKFFQQFLAFAAGKSTFVITALRSHALNPAQAYSPFTLSSAMTKQQSYLNPPLTNEVNAILAELPYLVTVTDVTNTNAVTDYQALGFEGVDLGRLKSFGHKQGTKQSCRIDEIALAYGHQRQEVRFKYKTPVIIECEGAKWSGQSADFSVSGLKVDIENPAVLAKGDIVYLTFPKLQKITSAFDLKKLPYKVMRISKDKSVVNLRVSIKEHQHIGRSFFKLLIDKNKNKLTPDEYAMLTPGLSGALRTLYAVNMAIPTAIVQSSGSRYKMETLVAGEYAYQSHKNLLSAMLQLSDRHGYYNLYPLLGNIQLSNLLDQHMKKLLASDVAVCELIYVAINTTVSDIEKSVIIKQDSDLNTPQLRNFFIKQSLKKGAFFALQLNLSRSDEAHMEYLNPELAYISAYAIHRSKQLEQEIYSVAGLVQLIDVTQETLLRYSFTEKF
ncbi:hypothetical protein CMT41_04400 [Colwellia sp. MT41]|uniref:PilZ domain-containing protein n=1 Tax=Colwellia sp. MT41 TaxID=58049 RepID=UPI0007178E55|nr:PilZ domain-containing protein [Colwellia sp. MT41]ALO34049.1 hypothetical protein CMT41_04400 [Colwellia sp. MT41]